MIGFLLKVARKRTPGSEDLAAFVMGTSHPLSHLGKTTTNLNNPLPDQQTNGGNGKDTTPMIQQQKNDNVTQKNEGTFGEGFPPLQYNLHYSVFQICYHLQFSTNDS